MFRLPWTGTWMPSRPWSRTKTLIGRPNWSRTFSKMTPPLVRSRNTWLRGLRIKKTGYIKHYHKCSAVNDFISSSSPTSTGSTTCTSTTRFRFQSTPVRVGSFQGKRSWVSEAVQSTWPGWSRGCWTTNNDSKGLYKRFKCHSRS